MKEEIINYSWFVQMGQIELSLEGTVKEAGIRNGDFLEIVASVIDHKNHRLII